MWEIKTARSIINEQNLSCRMREIWTIWKRDKTENLGMYCSSV